MGKRQVNLGPAITRSDKVRLSRARAKLLRWFEEQRVDLPWRRAGASEFELVCVEVLLQRTRAQVIASFYEAFFQRFKSWNDISSASVGELEEFFKPIGLWRRRAASIKRLADYAVQRGGKFPGTSTDLAEVPGAGQYIANAILLFQHGKPRPLLDVNLARVIERYLRPRRLADIRYDPYLQEAAAWLVKSSHSKLVNWAALDLGRIVCIAGQPRCPICPLRDDCNYARANQGIR